MLTIQIISGVGIGIIISAVVLALTTPLFIKNLVNTPGGSEKSGMHFFTFPEEGKVKIVVRGDVVVRMIMLYGEHRFARTGSKDSPEYWKIVDGASEDPLEGISKFMRPWAQYVYATTGAVFTGIYPFQTVREYPIERTQMLRDEVQDKETNIRLHVKRDFSDHLRAREFLYPFRVGAADTKDKVPLNILAVIKARVVNPHKAAFGTDRWDVQLVNLATNAVTNYTRAHDIDQTLSVSDPAHAEAMNLAIQAIQEDEENYGIQIEGVDIIEISPVLSEADRSKLYAEVLAKSEGKATVIDGKSRAQALKDLNKANAAGGEYSIETMRAEALVRAADAAKGGTIILTAAATGANTDPTQAAILAELKKLNAGRNP